MPVKKTCAVLLATALTAVALPAAAHARGTIAYDGTTMTFTGDAARDQVSVAPSQGDLAWTTSGLDAVPAECRTDEYVDYLAYCPWPQKIVVHLGGGDDGFSIGGAAWDPFPAHIAVEAHGDDGNDRLQSAQLQYGGPGNDRLEGHDGDQVLHGGPGNDDVNGLLGNDQVFGEEGNDTLSGDGHKGALGNDVIDGGPDADAIVTDWSLEDIRAAVPVNVTLDGAANDGRPGEADDVTNVESLRTYAGGTLTGTDGPDEILIEPAQYRGPATVSGRGGNDRLVGDDDVETIDGGPGDDYVEGGFNNDTLIGGPGRDTVFADETGAHCNYWTWCLGPFGNDTVDVRDGEVDTVDCGVGTDTVKADPADVLSNCESVDTGVVVPDPRRDPNPRRDPTPRRGPKLGVRIASVKLGPALRNGLVVRVAAPAAGTVKVTVKRGRAAVASGSAKVRKAGGAAVKVRFSRAGKRALRGTRSAKLSVAVRFAPKRGAAVTTTKALTLRR